AVATRARHEDLGLPDLGRGRLPPSLEHEDGSGASSSRNRLSDGLEWPLRLAAGWQQGGAAPGRLTQAGTPFTKDLTRLQGDEVLTAPAADHLADVTDPGVLALFWARAAGLLDETDGELRANPFPDAWDAGLFPALTHLFAALPHVEAWDPLAGYTPGDTAL